MRKYNIFCGILFALSVLFMGTTALIKSLQGEKVSAPYFRFHKSNNGDTSFNYWSLLLPIQIESQKTQRISTEFVNRVNYPIARKFKLEEPLDKSQDTVVANQIAVTVRDSVNAPIFKNWCNLDGNAIGVHTYVNPSTLPVGEPTTRIDSMKGTASPEAAKYGFLASIMPNHFEPENKTLAKNRVSRTSNILIAKLKTYGIKISGPIKTDAEEVQLNPLQVERVKEGDLKTLDSLRYVDTKVIIDKEVLSITPITAPILLPLWIWLIGFLLTRNYRRSPVTAVTGRKAIEPIDRMEDPNKFSGRFFLELLLIIIGIVLIAIFWEYLMWIIYGILALALLALIWWLRHELYDLIKDFFLWIWDGILWIYAGILRIIHWIRRHWPPKSRPECRRVVIFLLLSLLLNLIFLINWLFF